eukprot:3150506-Rhodomonas_salina.1
MPSTITVSRRYCPAPSCTAIPYAAMRNAIPYAAMRRAVLPYFMLLCAAQYCHSMLLFAVHVWWYALCGTELAYGATRCAVLSWRMVQRAEVPARTPQVHPGIAYAAIAYA